MKQTPLHDFHQDNGAAFVERNGWTLPHHFGSPAAEYDAVRARAGWLDLADRAVLEINGPDSAEWLQGMLSNDVQALNAGSGVPAAVLNIQGKVLADVHVLRTEEAFLVLLDEPLASGVVEHLNRYLIADEVEIVDLSGEFSVVSIQGPEAGGGLGEVLGLDAPPAARLSHAEIAYAGGRLRVVHASHTGEPGFDLIVPKTQLQGLAELPASRAIPWVGVHARETLRVEAGIPRYGVDMDADTLLLETGLDDAVSFTKGCYLGQETVERIHSRGHVNRRLTGFKVEGAEAPDAGDAVLDGDRTIGRVTSAVPSPRLGCPLALGYLHRDYLEPGTSVAIGHGRQVLHATVHALPL
ncbi:MAG: aminomethyltransferase family protein [Deltaproteobacteria bacterium]|nr:aminomethyltransferase family protein [Deltaproteobacteria bacterium]